MVSELLVLIWAMANACPLSDGSPVAPFYVNCTTSTNLFTGSSCAPFPSLDNALSVAAGSKATISLLSSAWLSACNVTNTITLIANSNALELVGTVWVPGELKITQAKLVSSARSSFLLDITGTLILENCTVTGFQAFPIHVQGQVHVSNSLFTGNTRGVFASLVLGGNLTVIQSEFIRNAELSGAVFYIYPVKGLKATLFFIANCVFEGNGAKEGSSVLALNDYGAPTSLQKQTINFFTCRFQGHPVSTFQIISRLFILSIQESKFENETQLVIATLTNSAISLAQLAVTNSKGPLFVLRLLGVFNLTSSNFTYIEKGPLVTAKGVGASASLLWLAQLYVANISNSDLITYGNLLNAWDAAIWLDAVRIENFTCVTNGVFFLIQSVLLGRDFVANTGSSPSNIVGIAFFSVYSLNDTLIEALNSGGTMWNFFNCSAVFRRITYRRIDGFLTTSKLYSTNLFIFRSNSEVSIDELDVVTQNQGTPLIFLFNSSLLLANSVVTGPIGLSAFSTNGGFFQLRQVTLNISIAISVIRGQAGGIFDIDVLSLRDTSVSHSVCSLSSDTMIVITNLLLVNVVSPSFTSGQHFTVTIEEARIEDSRLGTLLDSSNSV